MQTGNYIRHQKELLNMVSVEEQEVVRTFLDMKNGKQVDFVEKSERLVAWAQRWIDEIK